MPNSKNIVDDLRDLMFELNNTLSVKQKVELLVKWKYPKLLRELLFFTFSIDFKVGLDGSLGKEPSFAEKSNPNKRFKILLKLLLSNPENKLEQWRLIEAKCYKREWKVYKRIISKSMFPGITPIVIESVFPGVHIKPTGFMKCCLKSKITFPVIVEPKVPGIPVKLIVKNNIFKGYTESFRDISNLFVEKNYLNVGDFELDGILNISTYQLHSGNKVKDIFIYDIVEDKPLLERKRNLIRLSIKIPIKIIPFCEVHNSKQLNRFKHNCEKNRYRGVICKNKDSPYKIGRSKDWINLSYSPLKKCVIVEVLKDPVEEACCALVVQYIEDENKVEYMVSLRKSQCESFWQCNQKGIPRQQSILGKTCIVNSDMTFVRFNSS